MNLSYFINTFFDSIDNGLNYIGVQLLKLPTLKIFSYTITPKTQTAFVFIAAFVFGTTWINNTFAHAGHGDEEADKLGNTAVALSGDVFLSPKEVKIENVANQTYPGIVMSDEYGSIFSSREGIVTKLFVNLGESVKKGQIVATISTASNDPEIVALIAEKKADIAVAQGQLNGATKVVEYLKLQAVQGSGLNLDSLYKQQKKAIDLSITTQKQQLQIQIDNLKVQIGAKRKIVEATKVSSQSTLGLNEQKQATVEKDLQGSIQNAIAIIGRIFSKSEISIEGFEREFILNNNWGARNTAKRILFMDLARQVFFMYSKWETLSSQEKFALASLTERAVKEGIDLLGVSTTSTDYSAKQLNSDIDALLDAYADKDIGLTTILSMYKELQKELLGSSALASGGVVQADAELAGIDQEISLLIKQIDLLDVEKQKELAELDSDQGIKNFEVGFEYQRQGIELQSMLIDAQREILVAQSAVTANQNALGAIQSTVKSTNVTAPFEGTISRKNVVVGQNVDTSTPLFDIVGLSANTDSFVRFEVPVADYDKLEKGKLLQINLGGGDESIAGSIERIAQSVNNDTQTITVEGIFSAGKTPYPLGTNVRVSAQGLQGDTIVEIPSTALGTDESGEHFVYKVLPNKTLKKWIVEVGYIESNQTYINKGLKASDTIVVNSSEGTRKDGMIITEINN